ncbi:hypothetical protein YC2023_122291 [Brassica napus]
MRPRPEFRQGDRERRRGRSRGIFSKENERFQRRYARSRTGRTPNPKSDLLSLSAVRRIQDRKKDLFCVRANGFCSTGARIRLGHLRPMTLF